MRTALRSRPLRKTCSSHLSPSQPVFAHNEIIWWGTFLKFLLSLLSWRSFLRFFPLFFSFFRCIYVRVCCRGVSTAVPRAQHSTAQRNHPYKAVNQVRADQSTYQKKCARACMRRPGCIPGAWSSWHSQVAYLHLKCWTIYVLLLSFRSTLPCERA